MKSILLKTSILIVLINTVAFSQGTYTSANYAAVNDILYVTSANNFTNDYFSTGTNYNWDFSNLVGTNQVKMQYKNPSSSGYSFILFPYIYIPGNTNLAATDGVIRNLNLPGQVLGTNSAYDYFKKSTADLRQVASAYKLNYNGTQIPVTTTFSAPDVIYKFPINFGNTDVSNSAYTTTIPTLYYENKATQRTNLVDGWGTVTTPYGTFTNALRMQTTLVENDTIALVGTGTPRTIRTSRELKWLDSSKKLPVLVVSQTQTATIWTTTKVEFLDIQRDFQSTALFVYSPFLPAAGDVVNFQNLSTNATTYSWDFGDPTSTTNTSSLENPDHTYAANGTYTVTLTASNGTYTNTTTMIVIVSNIMANSEFENVTKPKLYPNPFSKSITFSDDYSYSQFDLYAIDGKKMSSGKRLNDVDFSYLTNGIYILKLTTEKGSESFRIVKE